MRKLVALLLVVLLSSSAFADGGTRNECTSLGLSPELARYMCDGRTAAATAAGNSSQANATLLINSVSLFTTVTNGSADSARLPLKRDMPRDDMIIVNQGAGLLKLYPPVGSSISPLAVNAPLLIASGGTVYTKRVAPSTWMAIGLSTFTGASNPASGAAAATVTNASTIPSSSVIQRIINAGATTGNIIADGVINGQQLYVLLDKDSTGSVTFAAEATSNVCGGVNVVIAVGGGAHFVYDFTDTCWNAVGIGTV